MGFTLHASHLPFRLALGLLTLSLLFALSPLSILAQIPDAEVDFFVKPPDPEDDRPLTVGDQITLRLEVIHPVESRIILPQLEQQWESFEVIDQTAPEIIDHEDGTATTGRDIVVTLFAPGRYQTPRLVVTHRRPDGSVEELAAPIISLEITSVLTEDLELRDLKPQAQLPVPPVWPWVVGGLLLTTLLTGLLFGAGMWLYHRWQSRPVPVEVPLPALDTRPPEVIAHSELNRIEAMNLPAQNKIKQHYTLVSNCLRFYIEGRYQIPALEQTTAELRREFGKTAVSMPHVSAFMNILYESDLVKFARYRPPLEAVEALISNAHAVVDVTTPQPEQAEESTPKREVG